LLRDRCDDGKPVYRVFEEQEIAGAKDHLSSRSSPRSGCRRTIGSPDRPHRCRISLGAVEDGCWQPGRMDVTRHRRVETLKGYDPRAKAFRDHAERGFWDEGVMLLGVRLSAQSCPPY
jgi:hypothetical protein